MSHTNLSRLGVVVSTLAFIVVLYRSCSIEILPPPNLQPRSAAETVVEKSPPPPSVTHTVDRFDGLHYVRLTDNTIDAPDGAKVQFNMTWVKEGALRWHTDVLITVEGPRCDFTTIDLWFGGDDDRFPGIRGTYTIVTPSPRTVAWRTRLDGAWGTRLYRSSYGLVRMNCSSGKPLIATLNDQSFDAFRRFFDTEARIRRETKYD